ncbi:ArsC/Spx/MgsR family protein [Epibacterium ulvae]|uniref:Arsenate reductase n=1 Tax=Epibacterium ulvae TaxID=1156985 RepID=A0A1G5PYT0_9RHOB|nr:ArsC/Spx/MgsR family protein [Epibacterium ulvae]SCZ54577.1 arsenate reductase [Epibacterium ulvae]
MKLFGLKNCDTCRKALKTLTEAEFLDVRVDGVPRDLLEKAYDQFGSKLVNNRSTTWRELSEEQRARPGLDLLMEHPTLMKRPLIVIDDTLYLGWDKANQAALTTA